MCIRDSCEECNFDFLEDRETGGKCLVCKESFELSEGKCIVAALPQEVVEGVTTTSQISTGAASSVGATTSLIAQSSPQGMFSLVNQYQL